MNRRDLSAAIKEGADRIVELFRRKNIAYGDDAVVMLRLSAVKLGDGRALHRLSMALLRQGSGIIQHCVARDGVAAHCT